MRALMQRCRAWIPDFRTVNFLNLSQSSERPGRAAAHYPQNKTPQLAGFCHSAHRTAGIGGIGGIGAIQASLMNVSRVSFGEVQRSLAGIKSYAQVACAELFRHSVHRRQVESGLVRRASAEPDGDEPSGREAERAVCVECDEVVGEALLKSDPRHAMT